MNRVTNFPKFSNQLHSLLAAKANNWLLPRMTRCLHLSRVYAFPGENYRKKIGLPANPNAYGPLTDGPDYSFLDGRPTPPGTGRIKRAFKQKELSAKIIELTGDVDFAVANHKARLRREDEKRQSITDKKLKPKGNIPPEARSRF